MAVESVRFGVGTFTLGGSPGTDFSCQVQSMGVNVDVDEGDTITVLCGDQVPGSRTYTYTLAGTVLQDLATAAGLVNYTWTHAGEQVAFTFVPSTTATTSVAGEVIVDPLSIGTSDGEFGDVLTSDFEWACADKPTVTWPGGAGMTAAEGEQEQELVFGLMAGPVVKVEGARELRKALKAVEGGLDDLKDTHAKIAAVVVPVGRSGAPRRSGRLAGSVRGSGTKTQAVVRAGGRAVPYGGPIHWGWPKRNIAKQPWLTEAAQDTEPKWTGIYHDDTQKLIDRAVAANARTHE